MDVQFRQISKTQTIKKTYRYNITVILLGHVHTKSSTKLNLKLYVNDIVQ